MDIDNLEQAPACPKCKSDEVYPGDAIVESKALSNIPNELPRKVRIVKFLQTFWRISPFAPKPLSLMELLRKRDDYIKESYENGSLKESPYAEIAGPVETESVWTNTNRPEWRCYNCGYGWGKKINLS